MEFGLAPHRRDVHGVGRKSPMGTKLIKIIITSIIIIAIALSCGGPANAGYEQSEMWELISRYSPNDVTTAAVMGWFCRESKLDASALSGVKDSESFIKEIDSGLADGTTKKKFTQEVSSKYGGFGLGQWCSECYVSALYDFAQEWGTSIADPEMQIAFSFSYMKEVNPWNIWEHLETATDPYATGTMIGKFIDGTLLPESVGEYAKYFYDKYGGDNETNRCREDSHRYNCYRRSLQEGLCGYGADTSRTNN